MLIVEKLYKEFKSDESHVKAVNYVSFEVPEGKFFTLLGPSGCGKTTTLRCIAGLERATEGKISIGGELASYGNFFVPPDKRNIGMVFQSYAIWPHMDVFSNVAFPLRVGKSGFSKKEIEEKVLHALKTVQLEGLEKRPATKLSGGQQQRLALARALVRQPRLLLLDEPLSNLDAALREHMRVELRQLQQRLGVTTVYVTHDQMEALALSDMIAVMQDGEVQQIGNPLEIYQQPANRFVAGFIGTTNWLEGTVLGTEASGLVTVQTPIGKILSTASQKCKNGEKVSLSVRPEAIRAESSPPQEGEYLQAVVDTAMFLGENIDCQLRIGEYTLKAKIHPGLLVQPGDTVYLQILANYCVALSS